MFSVIFSRNLPNYFSRNLKGKTIDEKCDDETASIQTDLQSIDLTESNYSDSTSTRSPCFNETAFDDNYSIASDHIPLGLDSKFPSTGECITQSAPRKSVRFSNVVRVCLIPCRKELMVLRYYIWWSRIETESFKLDAFMEIKHFIEHNQCDVKAAMFVLYQPVEMHSLFLQQLETQAEAQIQQA